MFVSFSYIQQQKVSKCPQKKHTGVVLDSKLDFDIQKIKQCNKIIGLGRRLSVYQPRKSLITIYKSFVRPHLDCGEFLHDKPDNGNFINKVEKVQYKVCLVVQYKECQEKNFMMS